MPFFGVAQSPSVSRLFEMRGIVIVTPLILMIVGKSSALAERKAKTANFVEFAWPNHSFGDAEHWIGFNEHDGSVGDCFVLWKNGEETAKVKLNSFLIAWPKEKIYADIWSEIFLALHTNPKCHPQYLQRVAAAGISLAREEGNWPTFGFKAEIVGEFRLRLPKEVQKEYILYLKKEWDQRPPKVQQAHLSKRVQYNVVDQIAFSEYDADALRQDFGKWCQVELEYIERLERESPETANAGEVTKIKWLWTQEAFVRLIASLSDYGAFERIEDDSKKPKIQWAEFCKHFEGPNGKAFSPKQLASVAPKITGRRLKHGDSITDAIDQAIDGNASAGSTGNSKKVTNPLR